MEDDDEEEEKYTLSLSILNFLKFVSKDTKTRPYLEEHYDKFRNILFSEQEYTQTRAYIETPVEIETTQLGKDFETLRESLTQHSAESIQPYNYVSFRILH